jgi:hypothetical protein
MSEYYDFSEVTDGVCSTCGGVISDEDTRLCTDFDHEQDISKGILCSNCKLAIETVGRNPETLRKASLYCEYWDSEMNY